MLRADHLRRHLPVGLAVAALVVKKLGASTEDADDGDGDDVSTPDARRRSHEALMLGGAALAGTVLIALIGRDLARAAPGEQPGAIRLLQLFTYNYRRAWPDTLSFSAILSGFAVVAVLVSFAIAVKRWRRHAVVGFVTLAFVWALWGVDVYMVKMSPHWGQHEVVEAYYRDRKDASEKLIAYQMNWKGENFYTGNRIPAFVSTGATFQTFMKAERASGAKVMYFLTEHSRIGGLKNEVAGKAYKEITDKALCNKFVLVRVEL